MPPKDELRKLDRSAFPPTTKVPELSNATVKVVFSCPPVGMLIVTTAVPCAVKLVDEQVMVTSRLSSVIVESRVKPFGVRLEVISSVPLVPAVRSMQPAAVSVADTLGVVRARLPLTVRYQSLALVSVQTVGVTTAPLLMVTPTPDRVRTEGMMLTEEDWLNDALTLSTVPPLLVAEEIEKHRLPTRVKPSPPKLPVVMHNWGDVVDDDTSVTVPPRPVPLSVLPRNDTEPPVNAMLADGSQGPEVAASVRERFPKKVNVEDPGVKVSVVGPESPSLHKVEKIAEHDAEVWGVTPKLEGPTDPVEGAVPGDDVPEPPVGALSVPDATVTVTGADVAKSLLTLGT